MNHYIMHSHIECRHQDGQWVTINGQNVNHLLEGHISSAYTGGAMNDGKTAISFRKLGFLL